MRLPLRVEESINGQLVGKYQVELLETKPASPELFVRPGHLPDLMQKKPKG